MSTASTPKGYPYPNGDDPISNGDNVITALATAVDTMLGTAATGQVGIDLLVANTQYTTVVTFPAGRFTKIPNVTMTPITATTSTGVISWWVTGFGLTSFIAGASRTAAYANFKCSWIAIGV